MLAIRDLAFLSGLLGAGSVAALHWLHAPQLGLAILGLVIAFNLLLPWLARRGGHGDWLAMWSFLLPLSVFQVLPDWVLSAQLGILHFPDLGAPRIGTVPVYMAGLWVIPLFATLLLSGRSVPAAAVIGGALFAASEWAAPLLALWRPEHVRLHFGVADYVLPAEVLLAAATAYAFRETVGAALLQRLLAAALVSLLYTGTLVVGYFVLDSGHFHF